MKVIILMLCVFLISCTTEKCNEKIICEDGREFSARYYNQETKQCENIFYTGGTPCFDESQT